MMRKHAKNCISQSQGSDQYNSTDVALASNGIEDDNGFIGELINCVIYIAGMPVQVSIAFPVAIMGIPAGQNWQKNLLPWILLFLFLRYLIQSV